MVVLHSFSIKNIFYGKMDLRLFYFHVMKFYLLDLSTSSSTFTDIHCTFKLCCPEEHFLIPFLVEFSSSKLIGFRHDSRYYLFERFLFYNINLRQPWSWSTHLSSLTLQLLPTNCLSVFDHFVRLALKG